MGNFAFSRPRSVGQCRAQITTLLGGGFSLVAVVMKKALSWLFVVSAGPHSRRAGAFSLLQNGRGDPEQVKFYLSLVR